MKPMLATLVHEPFDKERWVFEEKVDGIRLVIERDGQRLSLVTRYDIDRKGEVPLVEKDLLALPAKKFVLDAELLSARELVAFDLMELGGESLVARPLRERRAKLEELLRGAGPTLRLVRRLEGGLAAYDTAVREGWEGIVAKDDASIYEPGARSRSWLKVKVTQETELVVGGFTPPSGRRKHLGALLLGRLEGKKLLYAGKVGSGFDGKSLADLKARLDARARTSSPFQDAPRFKKVTWVEPVLTVRVRFMEWTNDRRLRHPVFLKVVA